MADNIQKTIIIGSGPAGYTAAIYSSRANLNPIIFTGTKPGGQLITTNEVENFPGYPEGTDGPTMMEDFRKQAERFGTMVEYSTIAKVDFNTGNSYHTIWTDDSKEYKAYTVIIATGAEANYLGLESEKQFMNKGVSACAVCDGFFYKGLTVGVVGGGDTACEEATYLAKLCPTVHMFVRRDELRASQIMQNRLLDTKNIIIHWNTEIDRVLGENAVSGVKVINNVTKEKSQIELEGLFISIGHTPSTALFKEYLEMDKAGYIITAAASSHTNIPGVFASGDAMDRVYRQAVTAAGTGCRAALDAERYLAKEGLN